MKEIGFILILSVCGSASAEIVDRISLVVEGRPIKHSEIARDIRITSLLNHEKPDFGVAERKKSAARLIDQVLIRKELEAGLYSGPAESDVDALLQQLKTSLGGDAGFHNTLKSYGVTEQELTEHLRWQLRVLRFVNTRFSGGAEIPEAELRAYYEQHLPDFRRAGKTRLDWESMRPEVEKAMAGERLNQQFFTWLDEAEKNAPIVYNEEVLK